MQLLPEAGIGDIVGYLLSPRREGTRMDACVIIDLGVGPCVV